MVAGLTPEPVNTDPFVQAAETVNDVEDIVRDRLSEAQSWAESSRQSAQGALDELAAFAPNLAFTGTTPTAPTLSANIGGEFNLPNLDAEVFGAISDAVTPAPSLPDIPDIPDIDVTPYVPSITGLSIPDAPVFTAPADAPERPVTGDVDIPVAPVLDKPAFPSLDSITIPTFEFPTLPTFDATAPEFEGTPVAAILQWSPGEYLNEIIDEAADKIRTMWAGGSGLPPAVEQAMWERAAAREDLAIARDIAAATVEFSSRGFTMPQGALVARIDAIREEGQIKKLGLNREITIKVAEWQIENLRFAVTQALAAEQTYFNIWNNIAQREFEAAKIQLDSQLALYNAQVALFNARMTAYNTEATIFEVRLKGELSRIEVFKAQLEGELARGTLNEQRVRIYSEQIKALLTDIEIYKAQMQGAGVQADVIKTQIDGYRADVQAYAERINADKVRFEAYEAQVKGELGKANILESESRAYASYVQGRATVSEAQIKNVQTKLEKNRLLIQQYQAQLEADKTRMQAQIAVVDANAKAYTANTQRYVAATGVEEARYKLELGAKEAEMRSAIALYEVEVRKYIADMEQLIRKAQLQLEAITAAGQAASTMAAGAMAGVSVGASLSGSGSVGASGSRTSSWGESVSTNTNHNYSY